MTAIHELDKAIEFLYDRVQEYHNHDSLKALCFDNSSAVDVEAIVVKLRNDGLTHYGTNDQNKDKFKISIEGRLLRESGGFRGELKRKSKAANLQSVQTWAIAIGTALAGTFALFQLGEGFGRLTALLLSTYCD